MSKHTPGPWFIDEYRIRCAVNQFCVCTVTAPDHRLRGKDWHEEHDICASNARLIAAAPELLEALQTIVNACAQPPWYAVTVNSPQMDAARTAIAKATGEQA